MFCFVFFLISFRKEVCKGLYTNVNIWLYRLKKKKKLGLLPRPPRFYLENLCTQSKVGNNNMTNVFSI